MCPVRGLKIGLRNPEAFWFTPNAGARVASALMRAPLSGHLMNRHRVSMVQFAGAFGFGEEAVQTGLVRRQIGWQDLDGDIAFDGWSALHARDRKPDPQVYAVGTGRLLHQLRRLLFGESSCKSKR